MKDDLGLKKLENDLNNAFSFNIFPKEKNKNPSNKQSRKEKKFFNGSTRQNNYKTEKKVIKGTASMTKKGIKNLIHHIRNRKIIKLEKQAMEAKAKADRLAHEIKTRQALNDSLTDITRYEMELEKAMQEEQERKSKQGDCQS